MCRLWVWNCNQQPQLLGTRKKNTPSQTQRQSSNKMNQPSIATTERSQLQFQFPPANIKRRRSVDPPEEGAAASAGGHEYTSSNERSNKRIKTVDDAVGSLSLHASDPPGNSFCRDPTVVERQKVDVGAAAAPFAQLKVTDNDVLPMRVSGPIPPTQCDQEREQTMSFQRRTSNLSDMEDIDPEMSQHRSTSNLSGMSIEDSDPESDSSVSESSIRNAMYQVVFGRRNLSGGSGVGGRYDVVDSKIEDLIRRSRMEAAIKSQKESKAEGREELTKDDDMDIN